MARRLHYTNHANFNDTARGRSMREGSLPPAHLTIHPQRPGRAGPLNPLSCQSVMLPSRSNQSQGFRAEPRGAIMFVAYSHAGSRSAGFLLLLSFLVPSLATGAKPVTWQTGSGTSAAYLTTDDKRACIQDANGRLAWAARLVPEKGELLCYKSGKAFHDWRVVQTNKDISIAGTIATGPRLLYSPCPAPPESVGWQPYTLPATEADAARRKQVADELVRRFAKEQRLRGEEARLTKGRMDANTLQQPAVRKIWEEIHATDEDNRFWLERTLRKDGWIGRKTHGDQAHQALVFIALHNIDYLRLSATVLAQLRAEWHRKEIGEMSVANVADRFALVVEDPMEYGIQATVDSVGRMVIPVIANGTVLDGNRARIGQPPIAEVARSARILRIGDDGRLVGEGAANARGLDTIDFARARREPAWGLTAAAKADPDLGAAIVEARAGKSAPIAAWTRKASQSHRSAFVDILLAQGRGPGSADPNEDAIAALQPVFDGVMAGLPARDDARIVLANQIAYSLAARVKAPTPPELARAVELAELLEKSLLRKEVAASRLGHGIADTIACIRYRQGDRKQAASFWKKAIALAGAEVPELYRRRLAVAEGADAAAPLPH